MNQDSLTSSGTCAGFEADLSNPYHHSSSSNRLTTWRWTAVLGKALKLAGPELVALDLPCGAGLFWPAFENAGVASLIAGDISDGMLQIAQANRLSETLPARLEQMSAFAVDLPDETVDFVACMRLMHHLSIPEDRKQVLRELHRVTREYVAVSLWVDGNLGSWRRSRKRPVIPQSGFGYQICRSRGEVEMEFKQAGFVVVDHFDVWPKLSMWRLYLLKRADI